MRADIVLGAWQAEHALAVVQQMRSDHTAATATAATAGKQVLNVRVVLVRMSEDVDVVANGVECGAGVTVTQCMQTAAAVLREHQIVALPHAVIWDDDGICAGEGVRRPTQMPLLANAHLTSLAVADPAQRCFEQAMAAYEAFDLPLAVKWFAQALESDSEHRASLFNVAGLLHVAGYPSLAVGFVTSLLILEPEDATAHAFLWALCSEVISETEDVGRMGEGSKVNRGAALWAYRCLHEHGNNVRASTKYAALTGQGSQVSRGDPEYAQRIYDDMGGGFEQKLVGHLGYKVPWLLSEMLDKLLEGGNGDLDISRMPALGQWRVLDMGCGSGLCGRIFQQLVNADAHSPPPPLPAMLCTPTSPSTAPTPTSPITAVTPVLASVHRPVTIPRLPLLSLVQAACTAGPLMLGVDVSQCMVDITMGGGGYDCAERMDLVDALKTFGEEGRQGHDLPLDLVIAADTFIYVGALGEVFALVAKALHEGGLFLFSTEDLDLSPMLNTTTNTWTSAQASASLGVQTIGVEIGVTGDGVDAGVEIDGAVPGWGAQLLSSVRFAHSHLYIQQLVAKHGFRLLERRAVILRTEETVPLPGNMYVLQKM